MHALGIDVGGTKTTLGLYAEDRTLLDRLSLPSDATLAPEAFFTHLCDQAQALLGRNGLTAEALRGVGIGVPSYVIFEEGRILKTSNLTKIKDFPARAFMERRLGVRVVVDNDAHAAALAEHRYGAGKGFPHMLYCPVSTGISSAIIIDGKLFRGSYGFAGESGHQIITPGAGIECGCENRGCIMSYASGSMIVRHVRDWLAQGQRSVLPELAGGAERITAEHILRGFELGDALAERAVDQMAAYMAVWLFNLYALLNINCYVFGGGLLHFGERLFPRVYAQFHQYNGNDLPVHFKTAALGVDSGTLGAAELLFD
jgi:glucokinase